MIRSLKILKEASVDIKEITTWYKNISPQLALRFVSQLYDGYDKIIASPDAWFNITKKVNDTKCMVFLISYYFLEKLKTLQYLLSFMKNEILKSGGAG